MLATWAIIIFGTISIPGGDAFLIGSTCSKTLGVDKFVDPLQKARTVSFTRRPKVLQIYRNEGTGSNISRKANRSEDDDEPGQRQPYGFFSDRIGLADLTEIRLDATLASCYVLCRFLLFDLTTGKKEIPGWELHDVTMLLQTCSSAILLSILWTTAGIFTRTFEKGNNQSLDKTVATAVVAAPLWLIGESLLGWPPAGFDYSNGIDLTTIVATGSIGLLSVMALGRALTTGWR